MLHVLLPLTLAFIHGRVETSAQVEADVSVVWSTVRNLAGWDQWQDSFSIAVEGGAEPAPAVEIRITAYFGFPWGTQETQERIYAVNDGLDSKAICWEVVSLVLGQIHVPAWLMLYSTERCIELTRSESGTLIANWIEYKGLLGPFLTLLTTRVVSRHFSMWNQALVRLHQTPSL
mmetsp:Transcript_27325/g.88231  ORF Transcript_27325/g.88231 Transcript_27325/m.88231 type:complete len:175 (+) Transcript_27325:86-610(+)